MAMVRMYARRYSTAANGGSYALGAIEREFFLCNLRTGEFRTVNFPFPCYGVRFLSTCKGLALVQVPRWRDNVPSLVIGNPVTNKWKVLADTGHPVQFAGLGRNPLDHSVELIIGAYFGRCDRYDFHSDRWIRGSEPQDRIFTASNFAWHRGCFYGLFMDNNFGEDDEDADDEQESKFEESKVPDLYRCQLVAGVQQWTPIGLTLEVKRLLWQWEWHLIVYQDRLLIYLWNTYSQSSNKPRCECQRMLELLEDGKVVEAPSWIDAADELDPDGDIPVEEWRNIGYGGRNDDFFWLSDSWPEPKYISLHSGLNGSLSEVTLPGRRLSSIVNFQDSDGDGDCDAFLDQITEV